MNTGMHRCTSWILHRSRFLWRVGLENVFNHQQVLIKGRKRQDPKGERINLGAKKEELRRIIGQTKNVRVLIIGGIWDQLESSGNSLLKQVGRVHFARVITMMRRRPNVITRSCMMRWRCTVATFEALAFVVAQNVFVVVAGKCLLATVKISFRFKITPSDLIFWALMGSIWGYGDGCRILWVNERGVG